MRHALLFSKLSRTIRPVNVFGRYLNVNHRLATKSRLLISSLIIGAGYSGCHFYQAKLEPITHPTFTDNDKKLYCADYNNHVFNNPKNIKQMLDPTCLTPEICTQIITKCHEKIKFIPDSFKTQALCDIVMERASKDDKEQNLLLYIPLNLRTPAHYQKALLLELSKGYGGKRSLMFSIVPQEYFTDVVMQCIVSQCGINGDTLKYVPDKYKTYESLSILLGNRTPIVCNNNGLYYSHNNVNTFVDKWNQDSGVPVDVIQALCDTGKIKFFL